jgi:NAD(P)-dependent dehydrogenase (short-subunit alcohol dehydrogenase family)
MAKDKPEVVVVTGASAGIGRATVRRFAKDGAQIGLIARNVEALENAKREVEEAGGKALVLPLDLADHEAVEAAAQRVEDELGPIDIWINNAMNSVMSPVKEMRPEEYKRVTEVTYLGAVYGTLSALKRMLPRDHGSIVLVGSALAYRGIPLQSAYCGAKHAMQGFADSLRTELMHDNSNVRLTMVQLPGVNTPQFTWVRTRMPRTPKPIGDVYTPEVAAESIHWAAHNERRELIVGMPAVKSIIGNKFVPQYADWVLSREGFEGQQTDQPVDPDRVDNLWESPPGDRGATGPFTDEAKDFSPQLWGTTHRTAAAMIGAGVVGAAVAMGLAAKRAAR